MQTNNPIDNLNKAVSAALKHFKPPENLTVDEWADKYRRLSPESSAEAGPWRTKRTPYLEEPMKAFTDPKVHRIVMVAASQVGKALAIDTPIPTPTGWKTMGELQAGDTVFDENGKPCTVLACTGIMHDHKCYDVCFSDGSKITADAAHKWQVDALTAFEYPNGKNRKAVYTGVITTEEMANSYLIEKNGYKKHNYSIPVNGPLELPDVPLPFDPYELGSLISVCYALYDAKIPPEYMRASYSQRIALLQGIMDADGSIGKRGRCEITLRPRQLIDDVSELLHSLGIKHTIKEKTAVCTNSPTRSASTVYRISFMAYSEKPVFRLSRKLERMVSRQSTGENGGARRTTETDRRRIVDVHEVQSVPVKCIYVDSESHLYLAGKAMIPTHNTELELNVIGYIIDQDPGSILYVHPTIDDAKKFSRIRVSPMIRDCKPIKAKVHDVRERGGGNTVLQKSFPGGMLTLVGSNSASALASTPCRYIIGDERDRWAVSAGAEGDPWALAEARQTTFYNYKSVEVSTPTIKGASNIENSFYQGTQERWCHCCPECGEHHEITFDDIHFEPEATKVRGKKTWTLKGGITWSCPGCGCLIPEETMRRQPAKWIAENPDAYANGTRSFWLNAFSSPWTPWSKIVLKFLAAKNDPQQLKVVYNTLFGQLWEERGDLEDEDSMMSRREDYGTREDGTPVELPEGVLVLTCGVDTQDNRLEYEVVGYGKYGETWGIVRGVIPGRPDTPEPWQRLDDVIDHVYKFKNGRGLTVSITCVDSGGHFTQEVYEACRARFNKRVFAIKGKGGEGIPFVSPPSKVPIRQNKAITAWLYTIGVDAGKAAIMANLKVQELGPKYCHFPLNPDAGYDMNFFNGLLSETLERTQTRRGTVLAWVKLPGHNRNEALDCRDYANAGFKIMNPDMDAVERRLKGLDNQAQSQKPQTQQRSRTKRSKSIEAYDEW